MTFRPFHLRQFRESRFGCPRIARVISAEKLGTMSKNNLKGIRITLVRRPIWGIHSLTSIISCSVRMVRNISSFIYAHLHINSVIYSAWNPLSIWQNSQLLIDVWTAAFDFHSKPNGVCTRWNFWQILLFPALISLWEVRNVMIDD